MKFLFFLFLPIFAIGQTFGYWQQQADYVMDVDFNVKKHQFEGTQAITYKNNSPEALTKLYYHLYLNAFQPGSVMDVRSRTIADPQPNVADRISKLSKKEQGYLEPKSLKVNGITVDYVVEGTILEVTLKQPILPNSTAKLEMSFEGQVPLQIRRNGRDNAEGIDYSMSQWYPKLCEYDRAGWHPNPYVAREFYGIWGSFDVTIHIDEEYVVAAGGVLQNADAVGHGYGKSATQPKGEKGKLAWHYKADNVHDFVWAADPDYTVKKQKADNGVDMFFIYQPGEKTASWDQLPNIMSKVFTIADAKYGKYPYPVYCFIQGGDGGMEYPMATLITGNRPLNSLVGVSVHELMHSWYQMMLGSDEARFSWMDEGFTSYASEIIMNELKAQKVMPGKPVENPMLDDVAGYINYATEGGYEEALTTHSDHFMTNTAFGRSSYTKGSVTLVELEYIMGKTAFDRAMLRYFDEWHFKHPTPDDFFRVMELESGLVLDWFQQYWVNTTHTMDYSIDKVEKDGKKTLVRLSWRQQFPMPLDVLVTYKDGTKELFYIPVDLMRGTKPAENDIERTVAPDWQWTNPTYELVIPEKLKEIQSVQIDPSGRLADVDKSNNDWKAK
jgi:Peptidase family M1 domain